MREMKDSGVEWIGEIPSDWKTARIKQLFTFGKGLPITKDNLVENGVSVISYGQIHSKSNDGIHIQDDLIRYVDKVFLTTNSKSLVKEGDFIFADTSEDIDGCGNCIYIDRDLLLFAGYHTIIFSAEQKGDNRYLGYLFKTDAWRSQIRKQVTGVKLFSISRRILSDVSVIMPQEIGERIRIADYLDDKCAKINSIIEKQQVIIEKLKEYKLSVINEALTHGLEETRNYKESGIDWIGKIPEHWSIQKLKTIVDILPGYAFSSNDFATDEGIPLLRGINVVPSGIRWNDVVFWNQEVPKYLEPYYLQENDIVVGLDRPWISDGMRTTIMNKDSLPCLLLQRVCRIRLKKECAYDHRLIYHWINSKAFESALSIETTGVSVPHISTKQIENFIIALPPNEEARSICDYLHVKTCEIDKSISIRSQLIGKLLDYKKSLIYEVVTGKREV